MLGGIVGKMAGKSATFEDVAGDSGVRKLGAASAPGFRNRFEPTFDLPAFDPDEEVQKETSAQRFKKQLKKRRLTRRVSVGVDDGEIELDPAYSPAALLSPEQRKEKSHVNYFKQVGRRQSTTTYTTEYDLMDVLSVYYKPDELDGLSNAFYTTAALLQRESLRFHPEVMSCLQVIWDLTDEDKSGGIDRDEFEQLFRRLYSVLQPMSMDVSVKFAFKQTCGSGASLSVFQFQKCAASLGYKLGLAECVAIVSNIGYHNEVVKPNQPKGDEKPKKISKWIGLKPKLGHGGSTVSFPDFLDWWHESGFNDFMTTQSTKEFTHDCFGEDELDKGRFLQSFFQLVDVWTEKIDANEYCQFLIDLINLLSELDEHGNRVFRDVNNMMTLAELRARADYKPADGLAGVRKYAGIERKRSIDRDLARLCQADRERLAELSDEDRRAVMGLSKAERDAFFAMSKEEQERWLRDQHEARMRAGLIDADGNLIFQNPDDEARFYSLPDDISDKLKELDPLQVHNMLKLLSNEQLAVFANLSDAERERLMELSDENKKLLLNMTAEERERFFAMSKEDQEAYLRNKAIEEALLAKGLSAELLAGLTDEEKALLNGLSAEELAAYLAMTDEERAEWLKNRLRAEKLLHMMPVGLKNSLTDEQRALLAGMSEEELAAFLLMTAEQQAAYLADRLRKLPTYGAKALCSAMYLTVPHDDRAVDRILLSPKKQLRSLGIMSPIRDRRGRQTNSLPTTKASSSSFPSLLPVPRPVPLWEEADVDLSAKIPAKRPDTVNSVARRVPAESVTEMLKASTSHKSAKRSGKRVPRHNHPPRTAAPGAAEIEKATPSPLPQPLPQIATTSGGLFRRQRRKRRGRGAGAGAGGAGADGGGGVMPSGSASQARMVVQI
jgi:hypothetical protein